jgi:di/tricarboxylate transporter
VTFDQIAIFAVLSVLVVFLVWGRWRFDIVAFTALIISVLLGLVPAESAFAGFGHPATVTVALVLVMSRILSQSGATDVFSRLIAPFSGHTSSHIGILAGIGAALSGFMNNVGTLGLLMPIALQTAAKAKRAAGLVLIPLSFGTILGGLVTLIGTPPNIIVAGIRRDTFGESFSMFDFAPVGGAIAIVGLAFVALIGWRLLPRREPGAGAEGGLFDIERYIAEASVREDSPAIGQTVSELYEMTKDADVQIVALIRRGKRLRPAPRTEELRKSDRLLLEAGPEEIEKFIGTLKLKLGTAKGNSAGLLKTDDADTLEVLVPSASRIEGRTTAQLRFGSRFGVNLLGVARHSQPYRGRLRDFRFRGGDVLLLYGDRERLAEAVVALELLPLAERGLAFGQRSHAKYHVALFAGAIALAITGLAPIHIALGLALAIMVIANLVPLRSLYEGIDWPVIVLLGALIPIGGALQSTGATDLIAQGVLDLGAGLPAWLLLTAILAVTMTLSDILNNNATAIVMAPIGITVAERLGINPDAFLMAVAIGASCAFLTPIGHQNNALVMGPGGYRFGDYWRVGLPLEILIVVVAVPMILWVWPL